MNYNGTLVIVSIEIVYKQDRIEYPHEISKKEQIRRQGKRYPKKKILKMGFPPTIFGGMELQLGYICVSNKTGLNVIVMSAKIN